MKPHELAQRLEEGGSNELISEIDTKEAADLLNKASEFRDQLEEGKFLEEENGVYVTFRTSAMRIPESEKKVDGIEVFFNDPTGTVTQLGFIVRSANNFDHAEVYARTDKKGRSVKISSIDARYEAIFGPVQDVVGMLTQE